MGCETIIYATDGTVMKAIYDKYKITYYIWNIYIWKAMMIRSGITPLEWDSIKENLKDKEDTSGLLE